MEYASNSDVNKLESIQLIDMSVRKEKGLVQ